MTRIIFLKNGRRFAKLHMEEIILTKKSVGFGAMDPHDPNETAFDIRLETDHPQLDKKADEMLELLNRGHKWMMESLQESKHQDPFIVADVYNFLFQLDKEKGS